MTGKRSVLIAGVIALWAVGSGTAYAFEQKKMPESTAAPAPMTVAPQPAAPVDRTLSLDKLANESKPENKGRSLKLPGIGSLSIPKLNFGLDLMYGNSESGESDLGFSSELDGEEDVRIMGKVKRRF